MADFEIVQSFEPSDGLNEQAPNLFFGVLSFVFLVFLDCLEEVTVVTDLHDNAQVARLILKEGLFVTDHIWMINGGQNSYFI